MFYNADKFNMPIGGWDTSRVRDFSGMFYGATGFNQPIGNWNTGSATSFYAIFGGATAFNQPIGGWDTSQVTNMADALWNAAVFDQDISGWNTSAVTNMVDMFRDAFEFNQPLDAWNMSGVTKTNSMFKSAGRFNQPLGSWDMSKNTRFDDMFNGAKSFNQDISGWNTTSVYNMASMFEGAESFNQPIGTWQTGAVEDFSRFLSGASSFDQPIGRWDTSKATDMSYMFDSAVKFNQDIGSWNTAAVEDFSFQFQNAEAFNQPIGSWNTSAATKMTAQFQGAESFDQNIGGWDTSSVTDFSVMFQNAYAFNQDIGGWDTSKAKDMSVMFFGTEAFDQDISGWNTSTVNNMARMFADARTFNRPIGGWNTGSVKNMASMFEGASAFDQDLSSWSVAGVDECSNFAGTTTAWGNPADSPPLPPFTNCDPTPTSPSTPGAPPESSGSSSLSELPVSPTVASSPTSSSLSSTTGIVVGVVCAVVAVMLLAAGVWWWIRRRRERSKRLIDPSVESSEPKEPWGSVGDLPWHVSIHQRLDTSQDIQKLRQLDDTAPFSPFGAAAAGTSGSWMGANGAAAGAAAAANATNGATLPGSPAISDTKDIEQGRQQGRQQDRHVGSLPPTILVEPRHTHTPAGYTGVGPLHCETHGSILHAKSPSMSHLSLEQPPLSAEVLEQVDITERAGCLSRARSWDGYMEPTYDIDSINAAEVIRRRRSLHIEKPLESTSMLELPAIGDDFVPSIDMHVPFASIEKTLTKVIGAGGYGKVYKGEYKGEEVAIKKLPPADDDENQGTKSSAYTALIKEIKLMSKFDSNRLVKVLGACTDDRDTCCLIMELMRGGDLAKKIHDPRRRRLTYIQILQITQDIAEGLAYLHPLVAHRDLKPGNILLDETGRAKIGDFGISKVKQVDKTFLSDTVAFNGTIMYMAPEQLNGGKLDEKVDVYSLGCIINEMWTRQYPWPGDEPRMVFQILRMVGMEGKRPWVDPDTPERLKRLITKCWAQEPRERPSCAEVVKTTEILIRGELKRLEERDPSSSCDASTVRMSFGRWSSMELSSAGTGAGRDLSRNLDSGLG